MIGIGLIERFYEAASIQRWDDHIRPVEFTELDKQAHKMIIAFVIAKFEASAPNTKLNWTALIEGALFEFLPRIILTDLKPAVYQAMMEKKGRELNEWVLRQLENDLGDMPLEFKDKFKSYLLEGDPHQLERRILKAAHYLATDWEFRIIYHAGPFSYGIDKTKVELEEQLKDHYDLLGVQKIALGQQTFGFVDLCGQLRFQQRWAQSPRIPKTSVLGHMLIVAMLSYLCSLQIEACPQRMYNNYFTALFHDFPEVLTRDIVSPIKSSVEGLQDLIKEYEKIQIEEKILPLLPGAWHEEMRYFMEDEFENKIIRADRIIKGISTEELCALYNQDEFCPRDGEILKVCDHLAAFVEASLSARHGIRSSHLIEGRQKLYKLYSQKEIAGINFGQVFCHFNEV